MRNRIQSLLAGALGALALSLSLRADEPAAQAAPPESRFQIPATDDGLPGAGPIRRSEWFNHLWAERRTQWASQVQQDQGAIVFLGDSITQGWGDVGSSFPGIKTANRGISGDTTRGVLIRLQEDVIALNPRGVVLLIGTNDLEEKAEPETIAGNLKLIVAALRQHSPEMPVVLCEVFPSSPAKSRPVDKVRKLNALYMDAVADQPQVTVLDTWSLYANVHGDAKEDEMPDLLHPNIIGYAKWAAALRPIFETVGLAPAWPDDFFVETGFVNLFDGHDLTGWEYAGGPVFKAKTSTDDGRYVVRNGRLVVTVSHKGQENKILWTTTKFPRNFVLKLEFRASPNADSGVFVREPQLQCRDFIIAGPFATLAHYRPLDWNEIVVTVRGGLAHCTCNGDVLVDAMPVPPTGPIGLESDHGQMEYRRIRVLEAR
ncbi:MAG TPA: GDSL-type esterase/lipase family protein [Opitutaceae bacterium]|nr:GDSL-type esterase/lipase family protein [Opitutaceae bacterium]